MSAALPTPRRVITGLAADGRSTVLIDGPLHNAGELFVAWRADGAPADNSPQVDIPAEPFDFAQMHAPGSMLMVLDFPPGVAEFWHATDTIDYVVMIAGEVIFQTETQEVRLKAGDVLVDRGIVHSWRNDTDAPARAAIVALPAQPVGKGRTV